MPRRLLRILSTALITAGLVLLADIAVTLAYEEPVSSVYAAIQQNNAENQLSETEANYPSALTGARSPASMGGGCGSAPWPGASHARRTPAKRSAACGPRRWTASTSSLIQGTDTASLQKGPGHFPETAFPGQGGTVGIAGHRTTYLAPFRHIDSMERGDRIVLEMPYATIVYRVQKTEIVDPTDVEVVDNVGYERLVLTSCHPVYSAAQRFVVFARGVRERLDRSARRRS